MSQLQPENKRPKTGGRQKGTPNRITRTIREAIEQAFHEVGGPRFLTKLAQDDPRAFSSLLARLIPMQVQAEAKLDLGEAILQARRQASLKP